MRQGGGRKREGRDTPRGQDDACAFQARTQARTRTARTSKKGRKQGQAKKEQVRGSVASNAENWRSTRARDVTHFSRLVN